MMNHRYYNILIVLAICIGCASCKDDSLVSEMTREQESLIGMAVNFDASISSEFTTRTTWNNTGVFNEDDLMVIYRQYYDNVNGRWDANLISYRVYGYRSTSISGTGISLNTRWKPVAKKYGANNKETFVQTEADSLTWENGQTVRYRAWALSNLSGVMNPDLGSANPYHGSWDSFYPDFTISDWVTASGPTMQIPLILRHVTNRIGFVSYAGNEIYKVEICTDAADYAWKDNSVSSAEDKSDAYDNETIKASGLTEAGEKAKEVKDVYDKMCMPGGVNLDKSELLAMSKAYYNSSEHPDIRSIERDADKMIARDTKTPDEITAQAVRPAFNPNNGYYYMLSIPYDMSNATTSGEVLVLPAHTRFRIYLRDTNNGDKNNTPGYEGQYHIVSLADLHATDAEGKNKVNDKMFPDGLVLNAGYSYIFRVGYHYNSLKIVAVNKDNLKWDEDQTLDPGEMEDASGSIPASSRYRWWTSAIDDAIRKVTSTSGNYTPEFHIVNEDEFLEFIKLVNGTASSGNKDGIKRERRHVYNTANESFYWWHFTDERMWTAEGDTAWIDDKYTRQYAEAQGYVFYNRYYPSDGDRAAYYIEEILTEPYSFYDNQVNRAFYVYLDYDLDMKDQKLLSSVGVYSNTEANARPFRGFFDGCPSKITDLDSDGHRQTDANGYVLYKTDGAGVCHTIKDIYLNSGYLFDYVLNSYISNLKVETTHNTCILNQGVNTSLLGISIKAPSSGPSLAMNLSKSASSNSISYVVGCIHEGKAGGALVYQADNMYMYGCMQTAYDLAGGALVSVDNNNYSRQTGKNVTWGKFMCNYYDTQRSPNAHAVAGITDTYRPQEYIRGRRTHILCAQNDNLLDRPEYYDQLSADRKIEFYGVAPWKAMNYGIFRYNNDTGKEAHPCSVHYEVDYGITGYDYNYPQLVGGKPTADQYKDVTSQNN